MKLSKIILSGLLMLGLSGGAINVAVADEVASAPKKLDKKIDWGNPTDSVNPRSYDIVKLKRPTQFDSTTCPQEGDLDYPCCPNGYWMQKDGTGADTNYEFIRAVIDEIKRGPYNVKLWGNYTAAKIKGGAGLSTQICHLHLLRFGRNL